MAHKIILFFVFIIISGSLSAQDKELAEQYRLQAEQRKRAMIMQVLDSAVRYIDDGQYAPADTKLVYVLNNLKKCSL